MLEGKVFHPYHGNFLLTLQEGIALLRYFVAQKDLELASQGASSGGSPDSGSGGSTGSGGSSSSSAGGSSQGSLSSPSSGPDSSAQPGSSGGHGVVSHHQQDEFGDDDTETEVDNGLPTTYDDYKMRMMIFAQVLKFNGVRVSDSLLGRLG